MPQLRFRQAKYFVEIVDAGSITQAASRLGLVPTALSLQIKKLEEDFNVRLLDRHARGVTPTDIGRNYYRSALKLLQALRETEDVLTETANRTRPFRFGMTPSVLHSLGVGALVPQLEFNDHLSIELVECLPQELVSNLESGELDFILGAIELDSLEHTANVIAIAEEDFVFITSAECISSSGPIDLEDAFNSDLISYDIHGPVWAAIQELAERTTRPLVAAHVVQSSELIRRLLHNGVGTAILPVSVVAPELARGTLKSRDIFGKPLKRKISFGWSDESRSQRDEGRIRAYVQNLINELLRTTRPYSRPVKLPLPESRSLLVERSPAR